MANWALRGFGVWSVEPKGGGAWLGAVGLFQPDWYPEPELGWTLAPEAEGRGFAFEAARAARAWAYGARGLRHARQPRRSAQRPLDPRSPNGSAPGATTPRRAPIPATCVYRHPGPEALA